METEGVDIVLSGFARSRHRERHQWLRRMIDRYDRADAVSEAELRLLESFASWTKGQKP